MKTVKPDNLGLLTTPCRLDGDLYLSIAVLACFPLDEAGTGGLLPEPLLWETAMSAMGDGEVLDDGWPKPAGEFIVYGAAHSPRPAPGMEITARVGNLSKTLAVTGERLWTPGGAPGTPVPFKRIPVTYRNAYGGPGFQYNPVGKGFEPGPDGTHPVPNIQYPGERLTSPADTAFPAGFAPYPGAWPQRSNFLGEFNREWLTGRWPALPADTSPLYFNAAPEDQRLEGFFHGTEFIELAGMHPEKPVVTSGLPALRVRLFVETGTGGRLSFTEVPNRAETLYLFPEALRGILLYRGTVPVSDEEFDDVNRLVAACELPHEPLKPVEEHIEAIEAASKPPEVAETEEPFQGTPEAEKPPPDSAAAAAVPSLSPGLDEVDEQVAGLEAETDSRLKSLGMTREDLVEKYGDPDAPGEPVSMESFQQEIENFEKETDARLKELGMDRDEIISKYGPIDAVDSKPETAALRGELKEMIARATGLAGVAGLKDAKIWKDLPDGIDIADEIPSPEEVDEAIKQWEESEGAEPPEETPGEEPVPGLSALSAAEALERFRTGRTLRSVDASGEDFTGCDLRRVDFTEAELEGAIFAGARLHGAVFNGAVLNDADFRGADLTGAMLAGATGPGVDFSGAVLSGADLSDGDWTGAGFQSARLDGVNLAKSIFREGVFEESSLDGADASGADFSRGRFSRVDFRGCLLLGADFSGASLTGCDFSGVRAPDVQFYDAAVERTHFTDATVDGLRCGPGTLFTRTVFSCADLTGASAGGARFVDSDLEGAALDDGDFSRGVFEGTTLVNTTARGTSFMKARFGECSLSGMNLLKGSFRNARLESVDLTKANLYGVDFFGAALTGTDLSDSNLKGTIFSVFEKPRERY